MYFEKRESKKAKKGYTWCVKFYYTDLNGIKRRYSKSGFETKAAAQAHGLQMQEELKQTGKKPENKTLTDVWNEWIQLKGEDLAPGTVNRYRMAFNKLPFADTEIRKITYVMLQNFMNEKKNRCKSTNNIVKALLSNLFKYAKKAGYIIQNPVAELEVTGKPAKDIPDPLTLDDILRICDALDEMNLSRNNRKEFKAVLWIGFYTGLRLGEIMALEVDDIDTEAGTLSVNKKVEVNDGREHISNRTKTKSSTAVIPVCEACLEFLSEYMKGLSDYRLFTVRFHTAELRLKKAAENAGIEGFHPHLLRHSFVSNVVSSGADPKTAAQLARHKSIVTTLDVYTHVNQNKLRNAVNETYKSPKKDPEEPIILA